MNKTLLPGEEVTLTIHSIEKSSTDKINVVAGEEYHVQCDKNQKWKDWIVTTDANGFYNILAAMHGMRIKHVKCFCLCGMVNESEEEAFAIGSDKKFTITRTGQLSFFANDSPRYYDNNKGCISIVVKRIV